MISRSVSVSSWTQVLPRCTHNRCNSKTRLDNKYAPRKKFTGVGQPELNRTTETTLRFAYTKKYPHKVKKISVKHVGRNGYFSANSKKFLASKAVKRVQDASGKVLKKGFSRNHIISCDTLQKSIRTLIRRSIDEVDAGRNLLAKAKFDLERLRNIAGRKTHWSHPINALEKWTRSTEMMQNILKYPRTLLEGVKCLTRANFDDPSNIFIGNADSNSKLGSDFSKAKRSLKNAHAGGKIGNRKDYENFLFKGIDFPKDLSWSNKKESIACFLEAWSRKPGKYIPLDLYECGWCPDDGFSWAHHSISLQAAERILIKHEQSFSSSDHV